jgi:tRNA pseudouridine38-40 synthase
LNFKGTKFHGWQRQINAPSIQEEVEKALGKLLKETIEITGAGRTDAGVHAKYYIAHFDVSNSINDISKLIYQLNCTLPYDIAVQNIFKVKDNAHARFDAISRTYEYHITLVKDAFAKEYSLYLHKLPDLNILNEVCKILFEYNDFTSFSKLHSDNKTNICKIYNANWKTEGNNIIFTICADRFLRNMVRAIVGTMLDVGFGKITIAEFKNITELKNRNHAGSSVPAQGLYLTKIDYPVSIFPE